MNRKNILVLMLLLVIRMVTAGCQGFTATEIEEIVQSACPDDGVTTATITLHNAINDTGSETFDASIVLEGAKGDYQTGTDTTAGTYNLNCDEQYTLSVIRADGDGGDNSRIDDVLIGEGATVTSEGQVIFTPQKNAYALQIAGSQHGIVEVRGYDNNNAGFHDGSGTYRAEPAIINGTSGGAIAVGAGGELDLRIDVRATQDDTDFTDLYTLILIEAPVATWNEPTIKVDGTKLSDVKGSLTADEEKQFSGYEYIYKYDGKIDEDGIEIDYDIKALAGQNPSTDLEVDLASAGYFTGVDGITVGSGAADDTSSSAVVFTIMDITIDIS